MWKKVAEPDRPHMTIWRMRTASWMSKATNTHSKYVIIISFPLQQWLHKSALILRFNFFYCNTCTVHLLLFFTVTNKCTINITTVSLCNLYCYMFRHFRVIIRESTTNALLSYTHSLNCSCWKHNI
jgi:hypothetical protein